MNTLLAFLNTVHRLLALLFVLAISPAWAGGWLHSSSIAVFELPREVRTTLQLIKQGGPFPYPRDGVVFGNYEHRLPEKPRGYYHEYTVKTPGEHGRGARRIVCGERQDCYYSGDHYQTFQHIEGQP